MDTLLKLQDFLNLILINGQRLVDHLHNSNSQLDGCEGEVLVPEKEVLSSMIGMRRSMGSHLSSKPLVLELAQSGSLFELWNTWVPPQ